MSSARRRRLRIERNRENAQVLPRAERGFFALYGRAKPRPPGHGAWLANAFHVLRAQKKSPKKGLFGAAL